MKLLPFQVQLCEQTNGAVIITIYATSKPHALKRAKKIYSLLANIKVL